MGNDKEITGPLAPVAADLHQAWADATTAGDLPGLCDLLQNLRTFIRQAKVFDDDLADQIAQQVHVHKEVEGIGIVEVKRGKDRKAWDHDRLTALVTARALDERKLNEDTGEYEREAEAVARVLRECAGFSYWKVTGLRKRGIDPDEYATTTPGRISVLLP